MNNDLKLEIRTSNYISAKNDNDRIINIFKKYIEKYKDKNFSTVKKLQNYIVVYKNVADKVRHCNNIFNNGA